MRVHALGLAILACTQPVLGQGALVPQGADPITLPSEVRDAVAIDRDGDGHQDLVVLLSDPPALVWLAGQGTGGFAAPAPWLDLVPANAEQLAVADLDADGAWDTILGLDDGLLLVALGDGTPPYALEVVTGVHDDLVDALVVDDVDGDGHLDLLTTSAGAPPSLSLFLGHGTGFFAPPIHPLASGGVSDAVVCDFDGDGIPDLAVSTVQEDDYRLLLGQGSGLFAAPLPLKPGFANGIGEHQLVAVDLDADGRDDLALANVVADELLVLMGTSDPGAGTVEHVVPFLPQSWALQAGDFDGDGRVDLLGFGREHESSNSMRMLLGEGDGTFQKGRAFVAANSTADVLLAEVTGDGWPDVISWSGDEVRVVRSSGPADLFTPRSLPSLASGEVFPQEELDDSWFSGLQHLMVDLDQEGWLDQVAAFRGSSSSDLVVACTGADDLHDPPILVHTWGSTLALTDVLEVMDLDGDGLLDLVVLPANTLAVDVVRNQGGCQFGPASTYDSPDEDFFAFFTLDTQPSDVDGDGHVDLVAADDAGLYVLPGTGDGGFEVGIGTPGSTLGGFAWALGDVDGDGRTDAAVSPFELAELAIWFGESDGTFAPGPVSPLAAPNPSSWSFHDFDRDGLLDLIASDEDYDFSPMKGHGDGSFSAVSPQGAIPATLFSAYRIADVDGNGYPDLVNATSVYLGLGDFTLSDEIKLPSLGYQEMTWADVDASGMGDLVSGREEAAHVFHPGSTGPWVPLGANLAGGAGPPELSMGGLPLAGNPIRLSLTQGPPGGLAFLVFSFATLHAPFKGGVLVPDPTPPAGLVTALPLDGTGAFEVTTPWPSGMGTDQAVWVQCWVPDGGAPAGMASTEAWQTVAN